MSLVVDSLGMTTAAMLRTKFQRNLKKSLICSAEPRLYRCVVFVPVFGAFFAIFFAYWIPVHLESALLRFKAISNPETDQQSGNIPVMTGGLVCIVLLCVTLFPRLTVIKVEKDRYPVSAFRFLADNNINGKMVVTYNWAQYAIAAFKQNPHVTGEGHISFDGRFRTCYPQQIVDMHFDFICGNGDSFFLAFDVCVFLQLFACS